MSWGWLHPLFMVLKLIPFKVFKFVWYKMGTQSKPLKCQDYLSVCTCFKKISRSWWQTEHGSDLCQDSHLLSTWWLFHQKLLHTSPGHVQHHRSDLSHLSNHMPAMINRQRDVRVPIESWQEAKLQKSPAGRHFPFVPLFIHISRLQVCVDKSSSNDHKYGCRAAKWRPLCAHSVDPRRQNAHPCLVTLPPCSGWSFVMRDSRAWRQLYVLLCSPLPFLLYGVSQLFPLVPSTYVIIICAFFFWTCFHVKYEAGWLHSLAHCSDM